MSGLRGYRPSHALLVVVALIVACDGVTDPVPVVGSVAISASGTDLEIGRTLQLSAVVLSATGAVVAGHAVAWSSSNQGVATVSTGGLVAAVGPGTARIHAAAGGRSDSLTVTVTPGACTGATVGALSPGQSVSGALSPSDCTLQGQYADFWALSIAEETTLRFDLTSADFDALLRVQNAAGVVIAADDDGGEGSNSRLIHTFAPGQYRVVATSYWPGETGAYQLSNAAVHHCVAGSAPTSIAAGDTRSGALGPSDCVFIHGVHAAGFRMSLHEPTGVRLDLSSTAFNVVLAITNPQMDLLWWNGGDVASTRIERLVPAGEYIVWVTSFNPSAAGPYELAMAAVEMVPCPVVGTLPPGQSVTGSLSPTDCTLEGERYADAWTLDIASAATVRIDLTSTDFDTFLILEDQHGVVLAWDDDGGVGLNSRLVYTFAPGTYRVVATSYGSRETGAYHLSTHITSAAVSGASVRSSPDFRRLADKANQR